MSENVSGAGGPPRPARRRLEPAPDGYPPYSSRRAHGSIRAFIPRPYTRPRTSSAVTLPPMRQRAGRESVVPVKNFVERLLPSCGRLSLQRRLWRPRGFDHAYLSGELFKLSLAPISCTCRSWFSSGDPVDISWPHSFSFVVLAPPSAQHQCRQPAGARCLIAESLLALPLCTRDRYAGFPPAQEAETWLGCLVPAGTPKEIIVFWPGTSCATGHCPT